MTKLLGFSVLILGLAIFVYFKPGNRPVQPFKTCPQTADPHAAHLGADCQ